ncbi:hypothetical protein KP509_23G053200 [Ceratopteris richardii]|nr:hypothetical protein KP509_23G053200 [Ceratopteris richardii]
MGSSYNEKRAYKIPPVLIDSSSRNIDTSSLNDIIEETWELPSLFRRGPTVDSNKSENLTWYLNSSEKRRKVISGIRSTDDRGWSPTWEGSLSDWSLQLDTSGLRETDSSWNEIVLPKKSMKRKLSSIDKDKERHVSDLQMSVRKKVVQFFENCSDDDNSDDSCVDSDSDVPSTIIGTSDEGKSKEERAFEFFLHMIGENNELKKLYNAQCYGDEIECLVCSSIPGKLPKKYNGLISVIKHANKILKTKRRQEHRGYAHAMCVAMGWDLQRLRSVTQCSSPHTRCCIP